MRSPPGVLSQSDFAHLFSDLASHWKTKVFLTATTGMKWTPVSSAVRTFRTNGIEWKQPLVQTISTHIDKGRNITIYMNDERHLIP